MLDVKGKNIELDNNTLLTHDVSLRLLSINEARKLMGIRHETLKKLINESKIEVIEIEGRIKIPTINLIKYQQQSSRFINERENQTKLNVKDEPVKNKLEKIIKKFS